MVATIITNDTALDELTLPLGFQFDALVPEGLSREQIQLVKTNNSRMANETPDMEIRITEYFNKNRGPHTRNDPRARYEGVTQVGNTLLVMYSEDWYATHFFTSKTALPRSRKGDPLSINGIVLTTDSRLPYGLRNPQTTDQGKRYHIVPAGFTDVQAIKAESPMETSVRKMLDEMDFRGTYVSEKPYFAAGREFQEELSILGENPELNPEDMRVIAIIYNSRNNYDTTMATTIPVNVRSSVLSLKGDEHLHQLEFVDIEPRALTDLLFEFSLAPDTNSGHFRGDIAALIAHRFGVDTMMQSLHEVHTRLATYI
ncbi:MAG: hypothetical protein EPN86_04970 [Nanoarchaeota archaeon]|nr:MAG: hypothetical protein EPN86_04970 [Nanoarchaeota archaeon]